MSGKILEPFTGHNSVFPRFGKTKMDFSSRWNYKRKP
jgi:hypothetical protein